MPPSLLPHFDPSVTIHRAKHAPCRSPANGGGSSSASPMPRCRRVGAPPVSCRPRSGEVAARDTCSSHQWLQCLPGSWPTLEVGRPLSKQNVNVPRKVCPTKTQAQLSGSEIAYRIITGHTPRKKQAHTTSNPQVGATEFLPHRRLQGRGTWRRCRAAPADQHRGRRPGRPKLGREDRLKRCKKRCVWTFKNSNRV